jgi:hypothetical protein
MSHSYKEMPPLWRLEELVELTDEHPSALRWIKNGKCIERKDKVHGFYILSIDNEVYLAHRVVYYLRTGECPDRHAVKHGFSNKDKDNRGELIACWKPVQKKRKPSWSWD